MFLATWPSSSVKACGAETAVFIWSYFLCDAMYVSTLLPSLTLSHHLLNVLLKIANKLGLPTKKKYVLLYSSVISRYLSVFPVCVWLRLKFYIKFKARIKFQITEANSSADTFFFGLNPLLSASCTDTVKLLEA
jgi:hypothetical protein